MKNIFKVLVIALFTSGCVAPKIVSVNQETVDTKFTKVYQSPIADVLSIINKTIDELEWVKLEEHHNVLKALANGKQMWKIETKKAFYTKSDYKYSWQVVAPKTKVEDLIFLKVRTKQSIKSLGAKLYLGIALKKGKTTVRYTGSTSQVMEKEKLNDYLKELSDKVNKKIEQRGNREK